MGLPARALLGSAAGIFVVSGVCAADLLPVKAKPVEYVRVCTLYGAGFWYVPGTDTCIKIGAFAKLQVVEGVNPNGPFMFGAALNGAADNSGRANRFDRADFGISGRQGGISFDMREQTEYGTLRSFIDVVVNAQSNAAWAGGNGTQLAAVTLVNTRAFIQFAGFTAGRMRSFFDMYFQGT